MPTHISRQTFDGTNLTSISHDVTVDGSADRLLIFVRHGQATAGITHGQVTVEGEDATQIGSLIDITTTTSFRRKTAWYIDNPTTGAGVTIAMAFSAQVAQYSLTVIQMSGAAGSPVDNFTADPANATSTEHDIAITPDNADSLLYISVMTSSGGTDPFTPVETTDTEIEDSGTDAATTNHEFASGYGDVVSAGVAQTLGLDSNSTSEWGGFVVEMKATPLGKIVGRSVDYDFASRAITIESGV